LRSFASRTVDAIQQGEVIFTMQAQFQRTGAGGLHHASPMPTEGIKPPEECQSFHELLDELLERAPRALVPVIEEAKVLPVEMREATGEAFDPLDPDPPALPARRLLWMKIREGIGEERLDESCAAYLSDQPLLMTALRPHRIQFPSPKLGTVATLDHSMWFHVRHSPQHVHADNPCSLA
jgi:acyl-CoA thioesterase-2